MEEQEASDNSGYDNLKIPLIVFGLLFMVIGLIVNSMPLIIFYKHPKLRNATSTFIINLCIVDILFCSLNLPFDSIRLLNNYWTQNEILCTTIPLLEDGHSAFIAFTICAISINRYIKMLHPGSYKNIYTKRYVTLMLISLYTFSYGIVFLIAITGFCGKYGYMKEIKNCTFLVDPNGKIILLIYYIANFLLPFIIILICYAKIFFQVRSSRIRLRQYGIKNHSDGQSEDTKNDRKVKHEEIEWKLTKTVSIIVFGFLLGRIPNMIINLSDLYLTNPVMYIGGYLLLYFSVCVNPFIYVFMNKQYKECHSSA